MLSVPDILHSRTHLLEHDPAFVSTHGAQVMRFLVFGGAATAIHWAVMWSLVIIGFPPIVATSMGAVVGSVVNYIFQFFWTFNGVSRHEKTIPVYLCTVVLAWVANAGFYYLLTLFSEMGAAVAQVSTSIAVAAMNFILYKRIVFHERVS